MLILKDKLRSNGMLRRFCCDNADNTVTIWGNEILPINLAASSSPATPMTKLKSSVRKTGGEALFADGIGKCTLPPSVWHIAKNLESFSKSDTLMRLFCDHSDSMDTILSACFRFMVALSAIDNISDRVFAFEMASSISASFLFFFMELNAEETNFSENHKIH